MKITPIGIDLAKEVFQIHGVDERGKVVVRKQLKRNEMAKYFASLESCLIGMEACGSAHHWARKLGGYGHTVKLMAPQFVKPYVKTNKNDMADAEAICEAVRRPNMRYVPQKMIEQQAILSVHQARQGFVKARTAQGNQIRGLLSEFGIVIPKSIDALAKRVPEILEDAENGLPGVMRRLLERLTDNLKEMNRHVNELEKQIQLWHRENEASRKLTEIPGLGPITASAIIATVGDAREFKNGRQLAAWLGLVPRQHSSGGKQTLLGISKRGDTYLRTLLIHGARAVIRYAQNKAEPDSWLRKLMARRNKNVAAVVLANKNARIIWALLTKDSLFRADYTSAVAVA
ncbi:putative family 20 transposase [Sulfuriferula plumbiphila]|uniref:Putative family 20 transposase n=1 Tax=Sulfuriferula plumbiphila TaxID=171865 RepID=A0A512L964_9PROT|nr:IS110 family transposase [Sulfuriferula plumbiphila]BBP03044.1 putative family 20 transposase [Sulfuriferula plumbiphila]GEP31035.1 putative family 20 transposase [Sulfuriferula plumbiphila]